MKQIGINAYLQFHKDKFRNRQNRRVNKFYKQMANFIKTRNALQCRSHHQKLQAKYRYPNRIISNYKETVDLRLFSQFKQQLQQNNCKNVLTQMPLIDQYKTTNDACIQSDIEGIDINFISIGEYYKRRMDNLQNQSSNNPYVYISVGMINYKTEEGITFPYTNVSQFQNSRK